MEKKYDGDGIWHRKIVVPFEGKNDDYEIKDNLIFYGMATGCGLGQVVNVRNYVNYTDNPEEFDMVCSKFKKDGVGAILATLGQDFYSCEEKLLALGFTIVSEYHNWRHGNDYMQKLYIKIL